MAEYPNLVKVWRETEHIDVGPNAYVGHVRPPADTYDELRKLKAYT